MLYLLLCIHEHWKERSFRKVAESKHIGRFVPDEWRQLFQKEHKVEDSTFYATLSGFSLKTGNFAPVLFYHLLIQTLKKRFPSAGFYLAVHWRPSHPEGSQCLDNPFQMRDVWYSASYWSETEMLITQTTAQHPRGKVRGLKLIICIFFWVWLWDRDRTSLTLRVLTVNSKALALLFYSWEIPRCGISPFPAGNPQTPVPFPPTYRAGSPTHSSPCHRSTMLSAASAA